GEVREALQQRVVLAQGLLLGLARGLLGAPALGQVSDYRDEAAHAPLAVRFGDARDVYRAARAVRVVNLLLERRLMARERALDEGAKLRVLLLAEHLAQTTPVKLCARATEPALVRFVVEAVALVGVEVGDGRGQRVEYEAQLLFAELRRVCERRDDTVAAHVVFVLGGHRKPYCGGTDGAACGEARRALSCAARVRLYASAHRRNRARTLLNARARFINLAPLTSPDGRTRPRRARPSYARASATPPDSPRPPRDRRPSRRRGRPRARRSSSRAKRRRRRGPRCALRGSAGGAFSSSQRPARSAARPKRARAGDRGTPTPAPTSSSCRASSRRPTCPQPPSTRRTRPPPRPHQHQLPSAPRPGAG